VPEQPPKPDRPFHGLTENFDPAPERDGDLTRRQHLGMLLGALGGAAAGQNAPVTDGEPVAHAATHGNLWPYDTAIPGSVSAPVLEQAQDTTGTTPNITIQTAAAKTGSGNPGGNITFVCGAGDGLTLPYPWPPVSGQPYQGFYFTTNTAINGSSTFGLGRLNYIGGGVVNLCLGLGDNGVGGGVAGVEIGCYSELSIATEGGEVNCHAIRTPPGLDANWVLQPCTHDATNEAGWILTVPILHPTSGDASCVQVLAVESGSFGTGTLRYYDAQLGGVRRFSVIEQSGYASLAFYDANGYTANEASFIAIPFGTGDGTDQGILVQRNNGNTADLEIITREVGELYFGSYSESNRYHTLDTTLFEAYAKGGSGFQFSNPYGTIGAFRSDSQRTIVQGEPDGGRDGCIAQIYSANTTSTLAEQTVAVVPLLPGVNHIHWVLTAWDTTGTDFASFEIATCYYANGTTVITTPSVAPTVTDTGHTAGAGTSIYPTLVPTASGGGTYVVVKVSPWTCDSVHWVLRAVSVVNTGLF